MSFNDLERGTSGSGGGAGGSRSSPRSNRPTSGGPLPLYHAPRSAYSDHSNDDDGGDHALTAQQKADFKRLADSVGTQIFKINSNTTAVDKLVKLADQKGRQGGGGAGGADATTDWTKRAHDLVESTRSVVKSTTPSLKELSTIVMSSPNAPAQFKLTLSRLQRDFESALNSFADVQKQSARKSKEDLEGAKRRVGSGSGSTSQQQEQLVQLEGESQQRSDDGADSSQQQQLQQQQQKPRQSGPSAAELEFQEALISEREAEIREIESGIHELNEIFRDLGAIVQEQGGMIDNIEYNINEIAVNTQGADRELDQANEYQRKSGKRAACLLLIVGFVISVVLVAILS